jgi:hypothetical protein
MALSLRAAGDLCPSARFIKPKPSHVGTFSEASWYGQVFQKIPGKKDILSYSYVGICGYLAQVHYFMAANIDKSISSPGVLLTGASSQIGVFAIPKLVNAGLRVFAVSRKGKPPGYPDFKQVQWLNEASAMDLCQNCEYLLSAGPLDLARKFMVAGEKFKTAIVFSSSSVETKQQSNDPVEKRQILDMLGLESELQSKAENTGLKLLILRPTLI